MPESSTNPFPVTSSLPIVYWAEIPVTLTSIFGAASTLDIAADKEIPVNSTIPDPTKDTDPKFWFIKKLCAISLSEVAEVPTGVMLADSAVPDTYTTTSVNASSFPIVAEREIPPSSTE